MKIKITNMEDGTTKTTETPLTLLQWARLHSMGFFKIVTHGKKMCDLVDPFTYEIFIRAERG